GTNHIPFGRKSARASKTEGDLLRLSSRDVLEHRPRALHVSVNGFALASQEVGADGSAQVLSVHLDESIAFVEVVSEQDIRLLLMNVEPAPIGAAEQSVRSELSDGRFLEARVAFTAPWPMVHVVYRDPLGRSAVEPAIAPTQVQESRAFDRQRDSLK